MNHSGPVETNRRGLIPQAMDRLEKAVETCSAAGSHLTRMLSPIQRPEGPANKKDADGPRPTSAIELAESIEGAARRLESLAETPRSLSAHEKSPSCGGSRAQSHPRSEKQE